MLDISTQDIDNAVIVRITGDVDLYSSPDVRKIILKLTGKKQKNILVDLRHVNYMDSSGVATLVEGLQQVNKYKGKLILFGLDAAVKEVFELSRLDKIFDIFADEETALENLA